MQNDKDKFLGTWRLISCLQTNPDGTTFYPWGENAIGYIMYSPENVIAVQIMRPDRKALVEPDTLIKDYNAYFGLYEIDEQQQIVTHHIEGHLLPDLVGEKNIRHYQFKDNHLFLSTVGGPVKRDMCWQKVSER